MVHAQTCKAGGPPEGTLAGGCDVKAVEATKMGGGTSSEVMKTVMAVLVATMVLSACGGTAAPGVAQGPDEKSEEWGPLAVVASPDGFDEALIEGRLQVTEQCVFLDEQGENVILVWPADRTTWNAGTRTITFQNLDGEAVTLGAGDKVRMGGGGSSINEDGVPNEEWAAGIEWVSPPAPSCVTETRWFVAEAEPVG